MKLSELAADSFTPDPVITGISADSREIEPGFLFAALPGEKVDGAQFIPQAEERGAAAILADRPVAARIPVIVDPEPMRRLALMAAKFFPDAPQLIAGVTGTNGKTSTARFVAQLWSLLGRSSGSIGTLGASASGYDKQLGFTTPQPVALHRTLSEMEAAGVTHMAMEVSSHGLAQHRADGVKFRIAGFTNITRDHLDFHATFEDYFAAKKRLFTELLQQNGIAVVNMDGDGAAELVEAVTETKARLVTIGARGKDLRLVAATPHEAGVEIDVEIQGTRYSLSMPLIGAFQIENALLAAGIVIAAGEAAEAVAPLLSKLTGAPGRMELAGKVAGASVFVDYAHTPDAIATALMAVRIHAAGRVIVVAGAGGDRDREKRQLMGAAAAQHADIVIVTDDNPRSEDPAAIRKSILAGCPEAIEIGDRANAVGHAVSLARAGDIVVIAGKGHETGQDIGGTVLPFSDIEEVQAAISRREMEVGR